MAPTVVKGTGGAFREDEEVDAQNNAQKQRTDKKVALITGITGQDGSYLTELLLLKGYIVHGLVRRSSVFTTDRIEHLYNSPALNHELFLHYGDLADGSSIFDLVRRITPDEIYNLAAMSHVRVSFEVTESTADINAIGPLRILNAIRCLGLEKKTRFYQASSSEMYGGGGEAGPLTENSPFRPRSPYAIAKQFAHWSVVNYRESYGMHACNGILFNHESPRRGRTFVTRKITNAVANIACGLQDYFAVGNLDARRDWGHAKDYVRAMWDMLQQETADDYVVATGEDHSVREFIEKAFRKIGISIGWRGARGSIDEVGYDEACPSRVLVKVDPRYFRPNEVHHLVGDATKARKVLQWQPTYSFEQLVEEMVSADLAAMSKKKGDASGCQAVPAA